ncbi:hypothetical protein [Streptomyces sp. NPDC020681]|uniref:hypothetical protein n=1 Tax=Streptomyces sp. NPDC020681 TaxID=3365083 RepID=UPI00379DEFFC
MLELSSHVNGGCRYYRHPGIEPGAWVDLKVEFDARSVVWWVNGDRVFAAGTGVGERWGAHLIVNPRLRGPVPPRAGAGCDGHAVSG